MSYVRRLGCLVVVLVLASAFLHVKVSVKVVRVFLGDVTCFWSTFVLGGGGNVTFCGIQGSAGNLYTLISPLYLRALVGCDVVRCQGILGVICFAGSRARSCRALAVVISLRLVLEESTCENLV